MLSAIGRASLRRVVAGASRSTNTATRSLWRLQRVNGKAAENALISLGTPFSLQRAFATAVKVAPAKAVKTTTTKSKAKPKTKAKAKKAAKKPLKKAKKLVKKPKKKKAILTPEKKKELKAKFDLKRLKETALSLPKSKPSTAWQIFLQEHIKAGSLSGGENQLASLVKSLAPRYRSMTVAELEPYQRIANENKATNQVAYKEWVESHTPQQIYDANNARLALRRKTKVYWPKIRDSRLPKPPSQALMFWISSRFNTTPSESSLGERANILRREWASLLDSERKPFEDLAAADRQRYFAEHKTVFGREAKVAISESSA